MAQTTVKFCIDENLKKGIELVCKEMGMSVTMARLRKAAADAKSSRNMTEHGLV